MAGHNPGSQFLNGNPFLRVALEDEAENEVELRGKRQDGPEHSWVLEVCAEGAVRRRGPLPWVPATGEVHQDNPKGPDIVRGGCITACIPWRGLLTFCSILLVLRGASCGGLVNHTRRHVKG